MHQYQQLIRRILEEGCDVPDRTGVGTRSVFGHQMRFDLNDGFPLVTTKRTFYRGMVDELLWFLRGETNAFDLPERTQKWWTPWMKADGDLGPIYGAQYRQARWWFTTERRVFEPPKVERIDGLFCGVGDLGEMKRAPHARPDEEEELLKDAWRDMIKRCYYEKSKSFRQYGEKGVHVCQGWLHFPTFMEDAQRLQGWHLKRMYPGDYSLDKDILFASNRYGPDTCLWASREEQGFNTSTGRPFSAISPQGERIAFASFGEAQRVFGLNSSAVHRCLNGELHKHHGWSQFAYAEPVNDKVIRFRQVDQLKNLLAGLKHLPRSRRHLINLWNTPAMEHAALPCCHGSVVQFYVSRSDKLSCHIYQRSADAFLGLPINIASYALLTHLIAHHLGYRMGELIWTGGDCHLYANHLEQADKLLGRDPLPLPTLMMTHGSETPIWEVTPETLHVAGYDPHPAIKAEVAV